MKAILAAGGTCLKKALRLIISFPICRKSIVRQIGKLIVKCILISPEAYDKLIDEIEDYYDSKWAEERLSHSDGQLLSMEEMAGKYDIGEKDLEQVPDAEIE